MVYAVRKLVQTACERAKAGFRERILIVACVGKISQKILQLSLCMTSCRKPSPAAKMTRSVSWSGELYSEAAAATIEEQCATEAQGFVFETLNF